MDISSLGKVVLVFGLGLAGFGLLLIVLGRGWLPRLPGDISFQVGGVRVFFPLVTCLVLSAILTVVLSLIGRR